MALYAKPFHFMLKAWYYNEHYMLNHGIIYSTMSLYAKPWHYIFNHGIIC